VRAGARLAVCAILVARWFVHAQSPSGQSVFRSGVQVVSIDASVRRRNTLAVLAQGDFELLDNGVKQEIEARSIAEVPVDVSMVLDEGSISKLIYAKTFKSDLLQIAATLRSIDRIRVITFATTVRELVAMQPARQLAVDKLTEIDESLPPGIENRWDLTQDPNLLGRSELDALFLALAWPVDLGRRHLVMDFSEGVDSSILDRQSIVAIAARSDALLHIALAPEVIGRSSLGSLNVSDLRLRGMLASAAAATGGGVHELVDRLKAFTTTFEELKQSYVLRYTLTGVPPEGWHEVVVKVPKCPDCVVRARKGYFGR